MALNVTTAVFRPGFNIATASPSLVQWDQGQMLQFEGVELPSAYQVEFTNAVTVQAITMIGNENGVEIPNELLQQSFPINAYIVLHETAEDRETEYWATIYVKARQQPREETPDPEQISVIDQTIAALQDGVAEAQAAANEAEAASQAVQDMGVEAETLPEGSAATVEKTVDPETGEVTLGFGIPEGRHGATGATPDIQIGTVTTGAPGSQADASITGTREEPRLNLTIPQGPQGDAGVTSVNGKTGAVVLDASDVGAKPASYEAPVSSVNGKTGAVVLDASDVGAKPASYEAPVSSVNEKTGAVVLDSEDIRYDSTETYSDGTVGKELGTINSALSSLDETLYGTGNYVEGQKLITTAGANRGELTPDSNYSTTELIPVGFVTSGTAIKVFYGVIPENTIFALYTSTGAFIDQWSLQATNTSRTFTFSYASYTDVAYVRFSFQKGYAAKITNATETTTYWQPLSAGGMVKELSDVQKSYMPTEEYLDFSMVNRLDPTACTIGKIINKDGNISDYSSYFVTDYIPIYANETLHCYTVKNLTGANIRMFAAYDADKNVIPSLGSNDTVQTITQSGDMAYVRCTIYYEGAGTLRIPETSGILSANNPPFLPRYGNSPVFVSDYIRKKIYINATDTETQIIQKFVSAFYTGNCDVIFERADYTFGTALATVKADYGFLENEIPIGNNCRYFFNGSTLTAVLDLANLPDEADETEYYCNFFGCGRVPSSYELHDGVLNSTDTRYVVHDESSAYDGAYKHLYHNMEMHYHTVERTETIRKCIGGGTGASGVVEIVGCKFTTDAADVCVSFHGNSTDVAGAKFDFTIRNSWFSNGIRAGVLSENQTARLFYCGNSASVAPSIYDRWTVTEFLNEIRT